jgi:prenyltransferase beta subunit
MSSDQLIALISTLCAVLSLGGLIVSRLIKGHTTEIINNLVKDYLSELKPNHGSSLRDDIICIKTDLTSLKVDVATLEGKFDQHIKENIN